VLLEIAALSALSEPCDGQEIKYIETSKPELLNPIDASRDVIGVRITSLLFRGLVGQDRLGQWIPEMAVDLPAFNEEKKELIAKLKPGLLWPDGTPVTATDVVHSFRIYTDSRSHYGNVDIFENFESFEAVDEQTVRIKLKRADRRSISRTGFHVMPKHVVGEDTYIAEENPFNLAPMGAGPYKVVDADLNVVEFELNPAYHRAAPEIEDIQMIVNPTESVHQPLLLAGFIDLDPVVRPLDLQQLQASSDIKVLPYDSQSWYGFAYNCNKGILQFKEVRQALTMAFNQQEAFQANFLGNGQLITGPYTGSSFCFNPDVQPYGYAPSSVDTLLDELGLIDESGDGIREYEGEPIKLKIVLAKSMSQENKNVCENYAKQIEAKQIQVDVVYMDYNLWYETVFFNRDFDITFVQWKFDEGSNIYPLFSNTQTEPGRYNLVQLDNEEIEEQLNLFRNSTDDAERADTCQRLHQLIHEEAPYTFLWTLDHSLAYRKDTIAKLRIHPFYFFTYIDEWILN